MRPYYLDPYTKEFTARIVEAVPKDGGVALLLDESYFYPTSGGQEHDEGAIDGIPVTDVYEDNGQVYHFVERKPSNEVVACTIDWTRRFGNMQQHTGQHMLSAAFDTLFDVQTVSSRLGDYAGSIDLSRTPTESEIQEAVGAVNSVIEEDRPISVHFADQNDITKFNLRKPPKVDGTVRIVEVKGFDMSACGGTHCTHTSEVGTVITGNVERVKGALTRIEFYCGGRARRRYYELLSAARDASRLLSSGINDLPLAAARAVSQLQERDARLKALSERMLEQLCEKLAAEIGRANPEMTVTDLSTLVQSTEELKFAASGVARKHVGSFIFYRVEQSTCFMNLNLQSDEGRATLLLNELRSVFGAKGGGRNGFYSLTFVAEQLPGVIESIKRSLSHA